MVETFTYANIVELYPPNALRNAGLPTARKTSFCVAFSSSIPPPNEKEYPLRELFIISECFGNFTAMLFKSISSR